jgi:hypothetical protein
MNSFQAEACVHEGARMVVTETLIDSFWELLVLERSASASWGPSRMLSRRCETKHKRYAPNNEQGSVSAVGGQR